MVDEVAEPAALSTTEVRQALTRTYPEAEQVDDNGERAPRTCRMTSPTTSPTTCRLLRRPVGRLQVGQLRLGRRKQRLSSA